MLLKHKATYKEIDVPGWERIVKCEAPDAGLNAYIAVHNTQRGPALGGCRMWAYASEDEALTDALRLSEGMTYKAIWSDLPLGGGKSCIIADPTTDKTEALFEAMGDFVDYMKGTYITAEDVGTNVEDLEIVGRRTEHVVSTKGSGDPSPMTAYGCFRSILGTAYWKLNVENIKGLKIGVLGLGKVGFPLVRHLIEAGATVFGADINEEVLDNCFREFNDFFPCTEEDLIDGDIDIFVPCALGGIINDDTASRLKAKVIAGSANNQLLTVAHGDLLHDREILYAPDYIINAGGLINVFCELDGPYQIGRAKALAGRIAGNLINIYERSAKTGKPTHLLADEMAKETLARL